MLRAEQLYQNKAMGQDNLKQEGLHQERLNRALDLLVRYLLSDLSGKAQGSAHNSDDLVVETKQT